MYKRKNNFPPDVRYRLYSGYVLAMFCRWSSIGSGNLYFSLEALGYFFQNLRVQ